MKNSLLLGLQAMFLPLLSKAFRKSIAVVAVLGISLSPAQVSAQRDRVAPEAPEKISKSAARAQAERQRASTAEAQRQRDAARAKAKIADQDFAQAHYNLGVSYATGRGVRQNDATAVSYFRKGAGQGNAAAQDYLGVMYQYGRGVAQDYAMAVYYFRKAADQGLATAQYNLGFMYYNGRGVAQDYGMAVYHFRKGADQGNAAAQNNLGTMYYSGRGVGQNDAMAVQFYRKAADQGHATAQYNLGFMYQHGRGVAQDYAMAVDYFRKSADQGHVKARSNLNAMDAAEQIAPPLVSNTVPLTAPVARAVTGDVFEDSYTYGYRLWEAKLYPEARATLEETLVRFPNHKRASYVRTLLGRAWLDDKKPATSVKVFYDNYKTDPRGDRAPDSLFFLGSALTDLGKTAEACEAFGELERAYPDAVTNRLVERLALGKARAKCK